MIETAVERRGRGSSADARGRGRSTVPDDAFDRAAYAGGRAVRRRRTEAAPQTQPELVTERAQASPQASPPPVEFRTKFPLRAELSPTGVVRGSWEHTFPYACKPPSPDTRTPCRKRRRPDLPRPRPACAWVARWPSVAQASPTAPVPPQNLEAEESVLGAMMLSPGAIGAVSEVLDAGDFYRESHGTIYRAALALYAKGEPVDAITLVDELEQRGELEGRGGRVRIHELAALVPATANAGALRADRPRDGDAPRADSGGRRDRPAGLGAAGRDTRPRRPRRAGRLRALARRA